MRVYLGIDGGGTKTRAVAVTQDGQVVVDRITDGCNVNHYGWPHAERVLADLFEQVRSEVPRESVPAAVYLGLAGADRPEDRQRMQTFVQRQWPDVPVAVEHDALPALAAGCGQAAGIVLIGGTGSVAFGMNETGAQCRVGGWGYLIGDEGSGYDIGRQALGAVLRSADGRLPRTLLTRLLLERYELRSTDELLPLVYSPAFGREQVGGVTRLVFAAAASGDEVSLRLLERAADELSGLVNALLARLTFAQSPVPVVLTGGLFHAGSPLVDLVGARVAGYVQVMRAEHPPVVGAVLLAQRLSGDSVTGRWTEFAKQMREKGLATCGIDRKISDRANE